MQLRQGDVLLIAERIPIKAEEEESSSAVELVLAIGESSGHAHRLCAPGIRVFQVASAGRFVLVPAVGAMLRHEEHSALHVPPGSWRVVLQREYAPQEGDRIETRHVAAD